MELSLPQSFITTITQTFGEDGRCWLDQLPTQLHHVTAEYNLTLGEPYMLSYNYVTRAAQADGTPVVLKLGVPREECQREITALRLYNGQSVAKLLAADVDNGVLLLETVTPGTPIFDLAEQDDEQATRIAAEILTQLWRPLPPDHNLRPLSCWSHGLQRLRQHFDGGTGPFPADLVTRAEAMFAQDAQSRTPPMLLHGDLHHWNILAAPQGSWLAIDPKGLAGSPMYDLGPWLMNPTNHLMHYSDVQRRLQRRVAVFAEFFGKDRAEIIEWGIAHVMLSVWWTYEDGGDGWEWAFDYAHLLTN